MGTVAVNYPTWVEQVLRLCCSNWPEFMLEVPLRAFRFYCHNRERQPTSLLEMSIRAHIDAATRNPAVRDGVMHILAELQGDMNILDVAFLFKRNQDIMFDCLQKSAVLTRELVDMDHVFAVVMDDVEKTFRVIIRNVVILEGELDESRIRPIRIIQTAWSNLFVRIRVHVIDSEGNAETRKKRLDDFMILLFQTPRENPDALHYVYKRRDFHFQAATCGSVCYLTLNEVYDRALVTTRSVFEETEIIFIN